MRRGIGARIAWGYGIGTVLLIVVAVIGITAINRTTTSFQATISDLNVHLTADLTAKGTYEEATVNYLRYRLTASPSDLTAYQQQDARTQQELLTLAKAAPIWEQAVTLFASWNTGAQASLAAARAGHTATANQIYQSQVVPAHHALLTFINQRVAQREAIVSAQEQSAAATAGQALWILVLASAVALLCLILAAWILIRSISSNLRSAITTLGSAAAELLAATSQQAAGTAEEAAAVQQTTTTIEELKQTVQVAAHKTEAVAEAAQKTGQISESGRQAVADTISRMQEVRKQMQSLAERTVALSEQSQAIGGITTTVSDLAEQSNLLAVNAAIEAAKAGEAGRGFGVVAAEVRSLATQSKQATEQVRVILTEIQRATQAAVMAVEQGVKSVAAGEAVAVLGGEAISQLTESIDSSTQMAHQILASSQQQVVGVDQISMAMENINQSSVQNMASTRQVEQAAQNLNGLAGSLNDLLEGSGQRSPGVTDRGPSATAHKSA
ncbi:MAG: methyl-accepting chemotaxis protein [Sulfobacillus sp.]